MSFLDDARTRELWEKVKAELSGKQAKLRGSAGQVVGFDSMGLAYAVPGWSNQNLLINADFRKPVNRNGKTSYSGGGPTIDGWQAYAGAPAVSLEDGAIRFSKGDWGQPLRIKGILPGTYTMSALASGGNFAAFSFSIPAGSGPATYYFDIPGTNLRMTFAYKWIVQSHLFYLTNNSDADDARVIAAKLERGPIQTLAHQDADGNWVLNDPPDYDLQYALCSLYSPITGEWVGSQHSNPNLLDNWYFVDPINQRGQMEYTAFNATQSAAAYTIDRFKMSASAGVSITCKVEDDGVALSVTPSAGKMGQVNISQMFALNVLPPGVYTLSWLYSSDCLVRPFATNGQALPGYRDFPASDTPAVASIQVKITEEMQKRSSIFNIQINSSVEAHVKLYAAKLELGSQQTLARQDADGKWVLNDPPPNKALELVKCQRYFERVYLCDQLMFHYFRTNVLKCNVYFKVRKRTVPTGSADSMKLFRASDNLPVFGDVAQTPDVPFISVDGLTISFPQTQTNAVDEGRIAYLGNYGHVPYVDVSADL